MWNDPAALGLLTRLVLAAILLFALVLAGRQVVEGGLPIRRVEVFGAGQAETRQGIRPVLERLRGGLFAVDLEAARRDFEALPWVRRAAVRRVWPDRLRVELEEHVPAAAWNDTAVLDVHGEVFRVRPWPGLPRFRALAGSEREVARRYADFARLLAAAGQRIASVEVDARQAWQLGLADGVTVDLGRERLDERLRRFITFYPRAAAAMAGIRRVDMRYPNGFAVRGGAEART